MSQVTSGQLAPPAAVEKLLKQLLLTARAVALYPSSSDIPRTSLARLTEMLHEQLTSTPELRFGVDKAGLFFDGMPVSPGSQAYEAFALELYQRNIASVRFHAGVREADVQALLELLAVPAEEIVATGGIESRLWEQGIDAVTVTEARVSIVDFEEEDSVPEETSPDEIDEIVAKAAAGGDREKRMLCRLMLEPSRVGGYVFGDVGGAQPDPAQSAARLSALAKLAGSVPDERPTLLRALAEAVETLDPDTRHRLLVEQLLPNGKTDEGVASVVRNMDLDGLCRALVGGMAPDQVSVEGLARAIKNLALISMTDRGEVLDAAGAAMQEGGFSEGAATQVLEIASPSRLIVRDKPPGAAEEGPPAEAIFQLMDLAVTPDRSHVEEDPQIASLREEAHRGITDGDVVSALVSLVALDPSDEAFARTMSMLEEDLAVLVERGDLEVAADAVSALIEALGNDRLKPDQRSRLDDSVNQFTGSRAVGQIVRALQLYRPGTSDYEAAARLLEILDDRTLEALLQLLAEASDMTARKYLIELLSGMAESHIAELAARLGDPRWYFVRNIVTILAATRQPTTLRYFERTIRHPEPRVRRETIRALSVVPDRRATEMLIAALSDDDEQSVQLAARYLGLSGVAGAVSRLEQVAKGQGHGNRDLGPRVEAIEALGRIGAVESMPALKALASRRGLIRGTRGREVRAAAAAALERVRGGADA